MDEEQIKQAEQLVQCFHERDTLYSVLTAEIFKLLQPTITDYLLVFFKTTDVQWKDIKLDIPSVIITCQVNYDTPEQVPLFMNTLAPAEDDSEFLSRVVNIRAPLSLMFVEKEQALAFLAQMLENTLNIMDKKQPSTQESSSIKTIIDDLSDEQQLLLFHLQKQHSGVIH